MNIGEEVAVTLDQTEAAVAWEALPTETREAVQDVTGPIVQAESLARKRTPGVAAILEERDGQCTFFKGVLEGSPEHARLNRERIANGRMPYSVPAPSMMMPVWAGGWAGLLFEYVDGRHPDLSPGSPDIVGVVSMLRELSDTPAWSGLRPISEDMPKLRESANVMSSLSPADQRMYEAALGGFDMDCLAGQCGVHYDLHPENMRIADDGRVSAIDWESACMGAPWIDSLMLVMILIVAGHAPDEAEKAISAVPAYSKTPGEALTGLTALLTLNCLHAARFGPETNAKVRVRAATAGRKLLGHRMS